MTTTRTFGPASNWSVIKKSLAKEHRLWKLPLTETLIFYDCDLVSVGQFPDEDTVYLRIDADQIRPGERTFPRDMQNIVHYLAFPSRAAIDATLHEGTIPTLETYRAATSILREVSRWTLVDISNPRNFSVEISDVTLDDIHEDELPYAFLKPGDVMEFTGTTYDELSAACGSNYVYPLPNLHTLVFYDCPRSWIGETRSLGNQSVHLHTMVDENKGWELCYRLTFPDEATLRATLYQGYVATRETFRQATKIVREELKITTNPTRWTLRVETMPLDRVPTNEMPSDHINPCPAPEKAST